MSARRQAVEIDPVLLGAVRQLVAQGHKPKDIVAAALAAGKRSVVDASREQKERLAGLIDALHPRTGKRTVFAFLARQKGGGIPVEISLEILERVADFRPRNFWGFVNDLMRQDYPHYRWGRQ